MKKCISPKHASATEEQASSMIPMKTKLVAKPDFVIFLTVSLLSLQTLEFLSTEGSN